MRVNGAFIGFKRHTVNCIQQLGAGEDTSGLARKRGQQFKFGGSQFLEVCARWQSRADAAHRESSPQRGSYPPWSIGGAFSIRRKTTRTRATNSFGLNGLVM